MKTRAEKVAEAQRLRTQGLKLREIADQMGVALSTADSYINDPDLSKLRARKASYSGECEQCGAPTDGSNGREKAPRYCTGCWNSRHLERNEHLREMWEAGEPTWYIAESLGISQRAVFAFVDDARRLHGEPLALRRIGGNRAEREARHKRLIQLRREGLTNAEIADVVGMANASSVANAFCSLHRKGIMVPDAAPSKRVAA